jgi:hypothetical protein
VCPGCPGWRSGRAHGGGLVDDVADDVSVERSVESDGLGEGDGEVLDVRLGDEVLGSGDVLVGRGVCRAVRVGCGAVCVGAGAGTDVDACGAGGGRTSR